MTLGSVFRTPSEIVNDYAARPPIDLGGLAAALGLEVVYDYQLGDLSGMITKGGAGAAGFRIHVNANHHRNRRRFTLAHEIGHYILHRDLIGDGVTDDAMYRSAPGVLGDRFEQQANAFAADILMPAAQVRTAWERGVRSATALATLFGVSAEAAKYRLAGLRLQ